MVNIVEKYHDTFESTLRSYLSERDLIDPVLPECDDVEQKWEQIATSFMPDALREFGDYPDAVLAWMMYLGMAVAKYWDVEWSIYDNIQDLYKYIREKRNYNEKIYFYPKSPLKAKMTEVFSSLYFTHNIYDFDYILYI